MTEFANKTQLNFDLNPESFAVDAILAAVYATPSELMETLDDLSRLSYLRASVKGSIEVSASGSPVLTVHLKDGVSLDQEAVVTFSSDTRVNFEIPNIDLSSVGGSSGLYIEVDVDTAHGTGSTTGKVYAQLNIEHPVIFAGC